MKELKELIKTYISIIFCIGLLLSSVYYGLGKLVYGGMQDIIQQGLNIFSTDKFDFSSVCLGIGKLLFGVNLIGISTLIILAIVVPHKPYHYPTSKLPIGRK